MRQISELDRQYNLWALLHQVSDIIFNAREAELLQYGIPGMQGEVLFAIKAIAKEGKTVTPAELSRLLLRRPHSVSGILSRMERAKLIRKTRNLHKKNLVRVTLTEKGEQAYKKALKRKAIQRVMSSLSEGEQQKLKSLLEALRNRGLKELGLDPKKVPFPKFV